MIYTGKVLDSASKPVAGARLVFSTAAGAVIPYQVLTDNTGRYSIDADSDGGLLDPGNTVEFIAPGFFTYGLSANNLPSYFEVTLTKKVDKAQLVVIGSGVAALLLLAGGKGKIMGTEPAKGLPSWVLPIAITGAGVGLVLWMMNKKDPKSEDSALLGAAAAAKLQELQSRGITPKISASVAESLASQIVEAANNCGTDEDAIYSAFANLQNEADFWLLVKTYGVRNYHACFDGNWFSDTPFNLSQTIISELSASARSNVNSILQQIGVNYSF